MVDGGWWMVVDGGWWWSVAILAQAILAQVAISSSLGWRVSLPRHRTYFGNQLSPELLLDNSSHPLQ
eukprot:4828426-Prorocentrum_lima.AAC.1